MTEKFLSLEGISVQLGGKQVLKGLDLNILKGEQWAITGPSGSGKSVLAHTLMGRHFHSGTIKYHLPDTAGKTVRIAIVEQQHRFLNRSGTADLYYQQRFNASDADQTITVEQELTPYADRGSLLAWEWLDLLHIRPLLDRPLIQLSNGENKRVQLAIALLDAPDMLILDNPFLGLDTEGRATLHQIINKAAEKGIQLLLITSPRELPAAITHIARLDQGEWIFRGMKQDLGPLPEAEQQVRLDPGTLEQLQQLSAQETGPFSTAVKMVDVHVHYGEKVLLQHIHWEVRKGERWNVSGPNGAGKSTLLSLITADNPQAYANEIWLFDRRRGSGETIWEIKQKIGFVSPELHLYFDYSASCFEVIASGLFDTIGLFRPLSPEQEQRVLLWMRLLSLDSLRSSRLAQLSTGQQRMILLARALIKNPPMLILDEPCQGLDEEQTKYFRQLIGLLCEAFGTTLIYVSHYREELPDCVDRFLRLDNGSVVL
ncbi:ATP-binding cassette domain-containing protein [Flavitalea sp. BT771]|uniref:ATP-binding cassette domain-containing protein n=1 Tax=Flavitalea sp. BT771 TaxID=3063329 RepID=UPI0026E40D6B|nr:ATP-binding cassette domain-containing protein [Flavitalea sp. BT771]MDO6434699.1 ATP-binding cassette domain-containing protein [Flavitalea sp. BT771]MDV6223599.1 ATP-binding cassette domain-containing protein [Flavitalea sp. BT771]